MSEIPSHRAAVDPPRRADSVVLDQEPAPAPQPGEARDDGAPQSQSPNQPKE